MPILTRLWGVSVKSLSVSGRRYVTPPQTRRHFDVVAESLRQDIQTAAEGVAANIERIDRVEVDLKSEMARGFAATHAVVRAAFRDLRCGID